MADMRYYTEGSSARKPDTESAPRRNRPAGDAARNAYRRQAEYNHGSAAPARRPRTDAVPNREPTIRKRKPSHLTDAERRARAARKAQAKAQTNAQIRYTAGMVAAVVIAVALCCYLLKLTSDVKNQKSRVASLKSQVEDQLDTNASYSSGLDSMTDLNEIYEIATTKLGMTYSQAGQTLYYSQKSTDYVVQHKDVPESD